MANIIEQVEDSFQKASSKIFEWMDAFIVMLPNLFVGIILIILFYLLARISKKGIYKLIGKTSHNTVIQILAANFTFYLVFSIGLFIVLTVLDLQKTVTSLLAGLGVLGLALALAFQEVVSNFIAGIILATKKPFHIGDIIKIQESMGTVSRTNLRTVIVRNFEGQELYIPNRLFIQNTIINFSILRSRRINLESRVSLHDDLELVEQLMMDTLKSIEGVIHHDRLVFTFTEFAESSVKFEIRFWINYPNEAAFLSMRTKAIIAIKKAFDQKGFTIPFPIRSLDFKYGDDQES